MVAIYLPIPREAVMEHTWRLARAAAVFNRTYDEGYSWLVGVVILGVPDEDIAQISAGASAQVCGANLAAIFDLAHKKQSTVRIEGFETTDRGGFYDCLAGTQ